MHRRRRKIPGIVDARSVPGKKRPTNVCVLYIAKLNAFATKKIKDKEQEEDGMGDRNPKL